jgi:hypothetical protein
MKSMVETIITEVNQVFGKQSNSQKNALRIAVVNMAYLNEISIGGEFPISKYLAEHVQVRAFDGAAFVHEMNLSWKASDGIDLRVEIKRLRGQEHEHKYRLATAAGYTLPENCEAVSTVGTLHDNLQDLFLNLMSSHAKSEWGYMGGDN